MPESNTTRSSIILSCPALNANVRAALSAFVGAGWDTDFNTSLSVDGKDPWLKALPGSIRQELLKRVRPEGIRHAYVSPARDVARVLLSRLGFTSLCADETAPFSAYQVAKTVDSRCAALIAKSSHSVVYGYEDSALDSFIGASAAGKAKLYELPIAYWETVEKIMQVEAERYPAWQATFADSFNSPEKQKRKTKELELCDLVIVPSQFVLDSLPEQIIKSGKKIVMAHFGTSDPKKNSPPRRENKGKLRLLFAGSLSQRKGLADLFGSFKLLKRSDVELVVLGAPKQPMDFYYSQYPDFVYESPRSHKEVIQLMQSCDALALPSLVEGCALVQQEAMSCGLPIIITTNTGGNHLIEDGKQGFIVPIRAPEKIAEKIDWFAEHRDETVQMGEEARRKAATFSWQSYQQTLVSAAQFLLT